MREIDRVRSSRSGLSAMIEGYHALGYVVQVVIVGDFSSCPLGSMVEHKPYLLTIFSLDEGKHD